jgi:hypothetical protein
MGTVGDQQLINEFTWLSMGIYQLRPVTNATGSIWRFRLQRSFRQLAARMGTNWSMRLAPVHDPLAPRNRHCALIARGTDG